MVQTCWEWGSLCFPRRAANGVASDKCAEKATLAQVLQTFRDLCTAAVLETSGEAGRAQCNAACDLVEALLLGVGKHLPQVNADATVQTSVPTPNLGNLRKNLITLVVRFAPRPIVGEIATRSRIPLDVWIVGEVRFSLQPSDAHNLPLVLWTSGLEMRPLPDVWPLRQKMKESLGKGYSPAAAYQWWQEHKEQFPCQTSKLRRVVDSLLAASVAKLLTAQQIHIAFWGFTQLDTGFEWKAFEFHNRGSGRSSHVSIMARFHEPSPSPEDAETFEWNRQWALREMKNPLNRHGGDRFVVSATNFGKMRYDKLLGLTGANVAMIVKLFSAVDWWGPGKDGWQKWDNTWLCTDKTDAFGRVIVEQGRILWRLGADSKSRRSSVVESAQHRTKALTTSLSIRWLAIFCFVVYFAAYHLRLSIASLPDLQ